MHIVAVVGSPRQGNSMEMARVMEEELQKLGPVQFELLWLAQMDLELCRGCNLCITRGPETCPCADGGARVAAALSQAQGLILISPVYIMQVSALVKNLFDRMVRMVHCPPLRGTPVVVAATSSGGGQGSTLRYMGQVVTFWGGQVVRRVGIRGPQHLAAAAAEKEREKLRRAARDLYQQVQSGRTRTVSFSSLLWFRLWQAAQSQGVFASGTGEPDPDREYWQEQGWLDPRCHYYYPVPLNPLQWLLGRMSAGILRQVIRRM